MEIRPIRLASALLVVLFAAACAEDEKACFDKINADLQSTATIANKSGNYEYATTALESVITASVILADDDRSACDYVTAGAYLERK